MRKFPGTSRRRLGAALLACSTLLGVAVLPVASADELKDRENKVQSEIRQAERHLDQSSARFVAAARTLDAAQAKLDSARQRLAKTRGELAVAEVLDQRMQDKLNAAVVRLDEARTDLADGREDIATQESALGQIAVQHYQLGDPTLLGLSMVLTSQRPAELTSQLNSVRSVLDKEAVTLDRLDASRVLLTVQERELEEARVEVAARRKAAAEKLELKESLEAQAQTAETTVSGLVAERGEAKDVAAKAKARDLRQLRGLERERNRIAAMLERRAEAARKRAARAAARAEAEAEAAAEADERESAQPAPAQPAQPVQPAQGLLGYPVDSYITSEYGMRLHPVYGRYTLHDGTDFGAACGTPIRAAASGTVIERYYNSGYGNRVIVDSGYQNGAGLATAYNHLSSYSTFVGERVARGEVIGYVGTTGYSTGCHLHFMVFRNGATVDPMNLL